MAKKLKGKLKPAKTPADSEFDRLKFPDDSLIFH
jgi:hypothetical protein